MKVDWYQLLQEDFKFINVSMNEQKIRNTSKDVYKKEIKVLINNAAFRYFMELKDQHKKLNNMKYEHLRIQAYLVSKKFNKSERQLLYSLRSNCHKSKYNFKKMHRNHTLCSLSCPDIEDQEHIFTKCGQ